MDLVNETNEQDLSADDSDEGAYICTDEKDDEEADPDDPKYPKDYDDSNDLLDSSEESSDDECWIVIFRRVTFSECVEVISYNPEWTTDYQLARQNSFLSDRARFLNRIREMEVLLERFVHQHLCIQVA